MALVNSGTFGSSPSGYYELYADQIGGSGNTRTIRVTLNLKVSGSSSSSKYGYPLQWLPKVHHSNGGWQHVKGSEMWYATEGLRGYSCDISLDVGTTSSVSLGVGFDLRRSDGGSSSWNTSQSGNFTTGSTNTAPTMGGAVTIRANNSSGAVISGFYPENTSQLYISWPAGADNEQGSSGLRYGVNQVVNGGGATTIVYPTTDLSCIAGIGAGGEGQTLRYYVDCRDNSDALSNNITSPTITKNTLTGGWWTGHSNDLVYESNSFTLYFTGGSNTDGSQAKYICYSDHVTIHNQQETTQNSQTITIWKSGALPSGPYIRFDELAAYFSGSNYIGRLHVGLRTGNNYGTFKYQHGSIGVDLRANPNPATGHEISLDPAHSTMYKKVAFSNNYYLIPDGSSVARIHWNAGSGKLGEGVSYELFVSYDNGAWEKLVDMANNGGYHYYNHTIPKQGGSKSIKYLVRTKNSYGWYSDSVTAAQTLHYYDRTTIAVGTIKRTETTADIPITVKVNSSIPGITISGTYTNATLGGAVVDIAPTQETQTLSFSGLNGNQNYTARVTYSDNSGFMSTQSQNISIGANLPVVFINKHGIGVGGRKADLYNSLNVDGVTASDGLSVKNYIITPKDGVYRTTTEVHTGALTIILPRGWTNTMLDFKIQVYIYREAQSVEYRVGGYNYVGNGNGGNWINTFAYATGNRRSTYSNLNVRFGYNGQNCLIYIGEPNTVWNYPQVTIKDVSLGYSNTNTNSWSSGWGITWSTGFASIQSTISGTSVAPTTPEEIGAAPASHNHDSLIVGTGGVYHGNGDNASHLQANLQIKSWFGIGFSPTINGQEVPPGENSHWFNTRTGDMGCRGQIYTQKSLRVGSATIDIGYANTIKVSNGNGYVQIGPENTGCTHYITDRPFHYFNREVRVHGDIFAGGSYNNIVVKSEDNTIYGLKTGNSAYMHVSTSNGAKGVDWWASDIKLKSNIMETTGKTQYTNNIDRSKISRTKIGNQLSAVDTIKQIQHFSYLMAGSSEQTKCGYIANQLELVNKDFVFEVPQEPTITVYKQEDGEEEIRTVEIPNPMYFEEDPVIKNPKPSTIIPYITKAIQEISLENEELKQTVICLKEKMDIMEEVINNYK